MLQHDPHITVITETWLREEINDQDVFPPCYNVYRVDRSSRGGGVAVLIKNQIEAVVLEIIPALECLCIKVSLWGYNFVLFATYRPPDAPTEFLHELRCFMNKYLSSKVILVGARCRLGAPRLFITVGMLTYFLISC